MARILIAGDFVPYYRIKQQIEDGKFSEVFGSTQSYTGKADYSIVNFESPVVNRNAFPISKTGPNLKCTAKAIEAIKYAGFNCITLANNHIRDYGDVGVESTIEICKKNGIEYVGGGLNKKDAEKILFKNIEGKKFAIINVCENEWSVATESYAGAAAINPISNYHTIKEAKCNADYVLVITHGGIELYDLPTPRMQELYRFYVEAGADAVVNHHQHCYSGYEIYMGKPIFYGLGNFCFDVAPQYNSPLWQNGYMVNLNFVGDEITFELSPYVQGKDDNPTIQFLNGIDSIRENIDRLNAIIGTPRALADEFDKFANKQTQSYIDVLEPFENRYIRKLIHMKLFPRLVTASNKKLLLNLIRCESHREILMSILEKDYDRNYK